MIQLIIIAMYLGLLLVLGMFASRLLQGTSKDYLLASHSIGPFLLLMSLFGTTMTAFALVGSTGEAYKEGIGVYGMLASSSGIIHSLCFFFIGVKVWKIARRHGYTTQIQFFRARLESDSIGLMLFPVLVGLVIPYLLIGVLASGSVINGVTKNTFPDLFGAYGGGVPPWIASLVICSVVLIYVFFGGMRGTAWANTFQTLVFMVLGIVAFCVIANGLGYKAVIADHVEAGATEEEAEKSAGAVGLFERMRAISAKIPHDKATRSEMSKTMFLTYLLVPLSVGMFPHLFQHWLTARSANSFKLPVVAHPLFILVVWVPCVLIGVWATSEMAGVPPKLKANVVLAFLVKNEAGAVLGGFLTAGILAAIMSSLDSQFLCLGTMFSNDMVLHYGGRERFTDHQKVLVARVFIVAIVAVTYFFSLFDPRRVFTMGVWCFSGFSSLFPLIVAALYWRRLTALGACASVFAAVASWLILFWRSGFGKNADYTVDFVVNGQTYQTMPVLTIFAVSAVSLVVVSLLTRPPSDATLGKFFAK